MSAPLVVYDTMVFLQAAIHPQRRYSTIEAVEDKRLTLCTSLELIAEVRDVLARPSLARKFPALTPERVAQFIDSVNLISKSFPIVPQRFTWPQHPDDDHIFNLAIESKASYLVTWETRILKLAASSTPSADALLNLAPSLSIITPKQLAELVRGETPPAESV